MSEISHKSIGFLSCSFDAVGVRPLSSAFVGFSGINISTPSGLYFAHDLRQKRHPKACDLEPFGAIFCLSIDS